MKFVPKAPRDDENVNVSKTHPVKEAVVLTAGLLAAGVALIWVLGLGTDLVAGFISPETEMETFAGVFDPEGDQAAQEDGRLAAVQTILDGLVEVAPPSPYRYRLSILDDPAPNAFAMIGGGLFVTQGLLDEVQSENELAFVLAHELGHFAHRDQIRGLGRGLATSLVMGALFGSAFGGSAEDLMKAVEKAGEKSHSQSQEAAADQFGLEIIVKRYGHLAGSTAFFERMKAREPRGKMARVSSYLATHPMAKDRIAKIRARAEAERWPFEGELSPLPAALRDPPPGDDPQTNPEEETTP